MAGAAVCSRLCVGIESQRILRFSLLGILAGAAGILLGGAATPVAFAVPMFVMSFFLGMSRPLANHMTLEQVSTDVGAASAVMTFTMFLVAGLAMQAVSLELVPRPVLIGTLGVAGSMVPMVTLALLGRRGRKA